METGDSKKAFKSLAVPNIFCIFASQLTNNNNNIYNNILNLS